VLIHRSRLIESGCDRQQAAKQTLEIFYPWIYDAYLLINSEICELDYM
jgi:hypothetical protein